MTKERDNLVERLRSIIEWVSERDHDRAVELDAVVHQLEVDAVTRQAMLKGMTVEEGAMVLELESPRELMIAWVHGAREMLGDAPNYSETRVDFPTAKAEMEVKAAGEFDRYVLTVQRAGKITPHEARVKAEAEAETLRSIRDNATSLVDYTDPDRPDHAETVRETARAILSPSS